MSIIEELTMTMSAMRHTRAARPIRIYLSKARWDALCVVIQPFIRSRVSPGLAAGALAEFSGVPIVLTELGDCIEYSDGTFAVFVEATYETYNHHRIPKC